MVAPTQLSAASLERLLGLCARLAPGHPPLAVETSPRTADAERLDLLNAAGASRISLGVQSFDDAETHALGRPQRARWVTDAIERIRARRFSVLNLDLIYGGANQTAASFLASVEAALSHEPEELYLYPLYVRPLTGLGKRSLVPQADARRSMYRSARERLLHAGYEQVSMRFFRRPGVSSAVDTCCQEDGTVGLGCGARSYTRALHYSFEWAVAQSAISDVVREYVDALDEAFAVVRHGFALDASEQRRRYVLKTCSAPRACCCAVIATFSAPRRFRICRSSSAWVTPAWPSRRRTRCASPRPVWSSPTPSAPTCARAASTTRWPRTSSSDDDVRLPRAARQLQLCLQLLPVREAARQPRRSSSATRRRSNAS